MGHTCGIQKFAVVRVADILDPDAPRTEEFATGKASEWSLFGLSIRSVGRLVEAAFSGVLRAVNRRGILPASGVLEIAVDINNRVSPTVNHHVVVGCAEAIANVFRRRSKGDTHARYRPAQLVVVGVGSGRKRDRVTSASCSRRYLEVVVEIAQVSDVSGNVPVVGCNSAIRDLNQLVDVSTGVTGVSSDKAGSLLPVDNRTRGDGTQGVEVGPHIAVGGIDDGAAVEIAKVAVSPERPAINQAVFHRSLCRHGDLVVHLPGIVEKVHEPAVQVVDRVAGRSAGVADGLRGIVEGEIVLDSHNQSSIK